MPVFPTPAPRLQSGPDLHEEMEKLATADDIAAAVHAFPVLAGMAADGPRAN
jgi:predicted DNA-binding protein with PD1-like motif